MQEGRGQGRGAKGTVQVSLFVDIVWEQELGPKLPKALAAFEKPLPPSPFPLTWLKAKSVGVIHVSLIFPFAGRPGWRGLRLGRPKGSEMRTRMGLCS